MTPNQPKTPMHSFRCPDDLWEQGKAAAEANGEDLAKALRRMLERYVARTSRRMARPMELSAIGTDGSMATITGDDGD